MSTQAVPTESGSSEEINAQLRQYREEQRRRHEQTPHDPTRNSGVLAQDTPSLTGHSGQRASSIIPAVVAPSAPPMADADVEMGEAERVPQYQHSHATGSESGPRSPLYPDLSIAKQKVQEEADARLARQLQQQEREQGDRAQEVIRPPTSTLPTTYRHTPNAQEEEDARLARQLQLQDEREQQENTTRAHEETSRHVPPTTTATSATRSSATINRERSDPSSLRYNHAPVDEQLSDDEQLAIALQQSEAEQPPEPPQNTTNQQTGILSTIGSIGRGLYNAYTNYAQAHQQTQQDAERATQPHIQEHQAQRQAQKQIDEERQQVERDEALARQMQQEDELQNEDPGETRSAAPFRFLTHSHSPPSVFRHGPQGSHRSPFGYDSDDDDGLSNRVPMQPRQQSWNQISALNSFLRGAGGNNNEPLFQHLQELMQITRNSQGYTMNLPRQRYVFPPNVLRAQGVQDLPPELQHMMQGEADTSYESLLNLAERMQPVSRGASTQQIDQLPIRTFTAGSMPRESAKCGICLGDYEPGEELTTLPCLHSFHKECITHWLEINKICPVCRIEIAPTQRE